MKITNNGARAFIVKAESVVEGGEHDAKRGIVAINPGETVEVTNECGELLKGYRELKCFDQGNKGKKK